MSVGEVRAGQQPGDPPSGAVETGAVAGIRAQHLQRCVEIGIGHPAAVQRGAQAQHQPCDDGLLA